MFSILIIYKKCDARILLAHFLERIVSGAYIFEEESTVQALEIVKVKNIDLILADIDIYQEHRIKEALAGKTVFTITDKIKDFAGNVSKHVTSGASGCIQLPEKGTNMAKWMNEIVSRYQNELEIPDRIMLSTGIGIFLVDPDKIVAIEKTERGLLIVYTQSRIIKEVRSSLTEILEDCSKDFIYINRQCAIRPGVITRLLPTTREIFISIGNEEIKFIGSRKKWKELVALFHPKNKPKENRDNS